MLKQYTLVYVLNRTEVQIHFMYSYLVWNMY